MKKRVTYAMDPEIIEKIKKLSDETMIPQSRLIEKAVKELMKTKDGK